MNVDQCKRLQQRRRRGLTLMAFVGAWMAIMSAPTFAQSIGDMSTGDMSTGGVLGPGVFSLVLENDGLARSGDSGYTNGVLALYVSRPRKLSGLSAFLGDWLLGVAPDDGASVRRGFAFGHSIFTPVNTDSFAPVPDERPYSARLYGEFSLTIDRPERLDRFGLEAGLIGPSALGDELQNGFHDFIGARDINGYENQIGNDFGVNVSYEQMRRIVHRGDDERLAIDVLPHIGATIGTIRTNARIGGVMRVGRGLKRDFGLPRVRPGISGPGYFTPSAGVDWNVFFGLQGRAVAYDVGLDGRLFRNDVVTVDRRTLVGDAQFGLAIRAGAAQIAYTYMVRSREFVGEARAQRIGVVNLSVAF